LPQPGKPVEAAQPIIIPRQTRLWESNQLIRLPLDTEHDSLSPRADEIIGKRKPVAQITASGCAGRGVGEADVPTLNPINARLPAVTS